MASLKESSISRESMETIKIGIIMEMIEMKKIQCEIFLVPKGFEQ